MADKEIAPKKEKPINFRDLTTCDATIQMLEKAKRDGVETAFDRALSMKACPIGSESACCKHCFMGPCRLNAKDPYGKVGVCGATIDTIQARNFARFVASGCAAHTDHGMGMLDLFREVVNGHITDYQIKDTIKLEAVAQSLGIETEGREVKDIATDLYKELERTYTQVDGEIPFVTRVPAKTLETWRKHNVVPRGAMREIMEMMHRTHMGVDQHYENITQQFSRTALADGWGGSMVATEISDILYGTPSPVAVDVNMGTLQKDYVNVIVHGHEPNMFESMLESVNSAALIDAAKAAGAKGINLVGMCCSGAEMMSRHGVPHAGNFMSTEAILVTGAVDTMCVDVQCIKQGLVKVAECYGTPLITTNTRCHIEGATHIQFSDHEPRACFRCRCRNRNRCRNRVRLRQRSRQRQRKRRAGRHCGAGSASRGTERPKKSLALPRTWRDRSDTTNRLRPFLAIRRARSGCAARKSRTARARAPGPSTSLTRRPTFLWTTLARA